MNNITKISEITAQDVWEYLNPSDEMDSDDENTINTLIDVAKKFIISYTGREDLDDFTDFIIVVFILCQDMWDNRRLYVDNSDLNKIVETILGLHSVNLL